MMQVKKLVHEAMVMFVEEGMQDISVVEDICNRLVTDDVEKSMSEDIAVESIERELLEEYKGDLPPVMSRFLERL